MRRPQSQLPPTLAKTSACVVYAEGGNEYHYLRESNALPDFKEGAKLPATNISSIMGAIKSNMANDAITSIYWIIDGGDEQYQNKSFKKFYIDWSSNNNPAKEDEPYWSKLKIIINHPCLEYWFLLHQSEPPVDAKENTRFFAYHKSKSPSPCKNLQESGEYTGAFPGRKKGTGDKEFIKALAADLDARNKAIARAKNLGHLKPATVDEKTVLTYPCAEMYQLFEPAAQPSAANPAGSVS